MRGKPDAPKTKAEWFGDQAHDSWRQGQAAVAAGRLDDGRRWLERARRFAPTDITVAMSLAVVLLRQNDRAAQSLFREVTQTQDLREAWFGLAASCAQMADWPAAAAALAQLLGRHAIADVAAVAPLADRVAAEHGAPGWICQRTDGRLDLVLSGTGRSGPPVILCDEQRLPRRPRRVPRTGASLSVHVGDTPLLGTLDLARLRMIDGFVTAEGGGLAGWAWQPANPEADPRLLVRTDDARPRKIVASEVDIPADRPFTRPRRFSLPAATLATWFGQRTTLVHVTTIDGRDLPGSPLERHADPFCAQAITRSLAQTLPVTGRARRRSAPLDPHQVALPAERIGPPARAPRAPTRRLAIVIPAYRNLALTSACLSAVQQTMPPGTRVIVIDDSSPEPALVAALDALAEAGRIHLLRHPVNRGFPAAANTGLRAAAALPGAHDIILLNADAVLTKGALVGLRALVHASNDIGTATPLSNDATILSYPRPAGNEWPAARNLAALARWAAEANAGLAIDIPTGVGFCLYIRRECLLDVGLFRENSFAQGYGEENDFCMRARHLGWRNVAAPGVFVGHAGGASFRAGVRNDARAALIARNQLVLERLHPGYHALIAAHLQADPLAGARRRLDAVRWGRGAVRAGATILLTHDGGGGVERVIRARCAAITAEGRRPIVLRPVRDPQARASDPRTYLPGLCEVCDGAGRDMPNLRYLLPSELDDLVRLLRPDRPQSVEIHHLQGHDPAVISLAQRLAVPWVVYIHDYMWFCPRVTLIGPRRRYCGEPSDVAICEACIADAGRNDEQDGSVSVMRQRSATILAGASVVHAPSADAAARISRHFPNILPKPTPLDDDAALPAEPSGPGSAAGRRRIGVVGAIGLEKGYDVLLACARDAERRRLPLEFVVIGHSIDDARLLATGRVFVTGPYRESEVLDEIHREAPDLVFLPSIWPETWCFVVGEAWRAGRLVVAFDIGAPAERIRRTGRGWLLPLDTEPNAVNDFLLHATNSAAADVKATRSRA